MAKELADVVVGIDPVTGMMRDTYEAITGLNMITQEELTTFERGLAVFGIATGGVGSWAIRSVKSLGKLKAFSRIGSLVMKVPATFQPSIDLVNKSISHWSKLSHRQVVKNVSYIKTFYKTNLWEIEEETTSVLTFKNYYAMKKSMLTSGTAAISFLTIGIFFKFMHWPGASVCIVLGIGLLSLVFLPLMFILKIKEKENLKMLRVFLFRFISDNKTNFTRK